MQFLYNFGKRENSLPKALISQAGAERSRELAALPGCVKGGAYDNSHLAR
jgi:hypothetical protein